MPTIDFKHLSILIAYAIITAILNLIFSKRSQIDEWCEANPKLAAFAKLLRGFGIDPWTLFQSAALAFTKKLPDYQKQSLSEVKASDKRDPPVPPPPPVWPSAAVFLLAIGFAFHVNACAPKSAADVPHEIAIAYAAANAALEVADTAETAYLDSLTNPTRARLDSSAAIVEKLKAARAELVAVHDDLQHGRDQLLGALSDLRAGVALASALGVKLPDKVPQALDAAAEALK